MKKVLVIQFSDLFRDARVKRQIEWLAKDYAVSVLGFEDPDVSGVEFLRSEFTQRHTIEKIIAALNQIFHRYDAYYWSLPWIRKAVDIVGEQSFDLIVANGHQSWPLALKLKRNAKLIFDAHEYYSEESSESLLWRLRVAPYIRHITKKTIFEASLLLTVSEGIANLYREKFGITAKVIMNCPKYVGLEPSTVDSERILLVHHGVIQPNRRIENIIKLISKLDERYLLTLILVASDTSYLRKLKEMAQSVAGDRITFEAPCKPEEVPAYLNRFDIGICLFERDTLNQRYGLPNKFFDFIQARLMNVTTPYSEEVNRLISQYDLGMVSRGFDLDEIAALLNSLPPDEIMKFKLNANQAAQTLNAEENKKIFLGEVDRLIGV